MKICFLDLYFSLQLERNRVEKLEKLYPNLICTQSLGHVSVSSLCSPFFCSFFQPLTFVVKVLLLGDSY